MDQRAIIEKVRKGLAFLQDDVLGVLIYGLWPQEKAMRKAISISISV
jgi:hypothetical protein